MNKFKLFDENFCAKLYETIEDIENNSLVEIVTIIKPQSFHYKDKALWTAFVVMALLFSFFMFSPFEFNVYLIYLITLFSFPFTFFAFTLIPALERLIAGKKQMDKNVEIYARAIFQKGGIRFTKERIGVLFYVSCLEEKVFVLPDRGAETAIPQEDWDKIKKDFNSVFNEKNPANAFLDKLKSTKETFAQFIPPVENDINELPDNLKVEL